MAKRKRVSALNVLEDRIAGIAIRQADANARLEILEKADEEARDPENEYLKTLNSLVAANVINTDRLNAQQTEIRAHERIICANTEGLELLTTVGNSLERVCRSYKDRLDRHRVDLNKLDALKSKVDAAGNIQVVTCVEVPPATQHIPGVRITGGSVSLMAEKTPGRPREELMVLNLDTGAVIVTPAGLRAGFRPDGVKASACAPPHEHWLRGERERLRRQSENERDEIIRMLESKRTWAIGSRRAKRFEYLRNRMMAIWDTDK